MTLHTSTHHLFSILDIKTGKYDLPFPAPTKHDAIRGLQMEIQSKPTSTIAQFPEDFNLACLGTFSSDGKLDIYEKPEILASAAQFSAKKQG